MIELLGIEIVCFVLCIKRYVMFCEDNRNFSRLIYLVCIYFYRFDFLIIIVSVLYWLVEGDFS